MLASCAMSCASTRCSRVAMAGGMSAPNVIRGTGASARSEASDRAAVRRSTSALSDPISAWSVPSSACASPGSSLTSTSPAFTRAPFSTATDATLPVSSGWIVLVRPTGWILPCAVAMMSTRPNQDHAIATATKAQIVTIMPERTGDSGVSRISSAAGRNSWSPRPSLTRRGAGELGRRRGGRERAHACTCSFCSVHSLR